MTTQTGAETMTMTKTEQAIFDAAGCATDNIAQVVEDAIAGRDTCSWVSIADAVSSHGDLIREILAETGHNTPANVAQALADVFVYEHCGAFLVGRAMTTQPRPEPKR